MMTLPLPVLSAGREISAQFSEKTHGLAQSLCRLVNLFGSVQHPCQLAIAGGCMLPVLGLVVEVRGQLFPTGNRLAILRNRFLGLFFLLQKLGQGMVASGERVSTAGFRWVRR